MFHEEKVINNILCYRNSPNDNFREYTKEALTARVKKLEFKLLKFTPTEKDKEIEKRCNAIIEFLKIS